METENNRGLGEDGEDGKCKIGHGKQMEGKGNKGNKRKGRGRMGRRNETAEGVGGRQGQDRGGKGNGRK